MTGSGASTPPDVLSCPVRGCGLPMPWSSRTLLCPRGHAFDVARSGYCNLLQPQDRKSLHPGDSRESVIARRRCWERGLGSSLIDAMTELLEPYLGPARRVLDVGSGDGFLLHELSARLGAEGWGLDISTPAAEAAARAWPAQRWIVANGDRRIPLLDGAFSAVTSITSRRNAAEFRRVLSANGALLLVVPAPDDLAELREALLGRAVDKDRAASARASLQDLFEQAEEHTVRSSHELDGAALADLLQGSYRGARHSAQHKLAGIRSMTVTVSYQLLLFRPGG